MSDRFADAFSFYDPSRETIVSRRRLPHWEQADATYFITFRTFDSLPKPMLDRWRDERAAWLNAHDIQAADEDWRCKLEELPEKVQHEFQRRFSASWHEILDSGHGECLLRRADLAQIVADSLLHFDGERYAMGDFIVMPNHVHMLAWFPESNAAMQKQCWAWKRYTAVAINRALNRTGHFWQGESYDHLVRSEAQLEHYQNYIAENPQKARLPDGAFLHYRMERWRK